MLSPRGRFRRAVVRINLPQDRGHAGHRAVPFGKGRPRLVLLLGSRSRVNGTSDGLSPHHGDDVAPPPAQNDVLRSPLPQPGHDALRRIRQSHRPAPAAQTEARGERVFVNDDFHAYADQWAYLASLPRLSPETVHAIAEEATRTDRVIGVPLASSADEDESKPWTRPPSRKPAAVPIEGPLPTEVRAILSQRLFVEKAGLPSPLVHRIKQLAAFQNPEFYKKQKMRLSTATTPRVICCAEDHPEHIALPRGCRDDLAELLAVNGISLSTEENRNEGEPVEFRFQGRLTAMQGEAGKALLSHDDGVFVAPPGAGKTVVGAYLTAARGRNTLVLVHRKPILDQWVARLSSFLGVEPKEIGRIGGGKNAPNGRLDVGMIQSLVRKGEVSDLVAGYGHVIVDECH